MRISRLSCAARLLPGAVPTRRRSMAAAQGAFVQKREVDAAPAARVAAVFDSFRLVKPESQARVATHAAVKAEAAAPEALPAAPAKRKRGSDGVAQPALPARPAKARSSKPSAAAAARAALAAAPSAFACHCELAPGAPPPPAALAALPPAFVAPPPGLWRERYAAACAGCFAASAPCTHHAERSLRLLLIGHNPSTHAWASGFPYSNPSNRFWKLMAGAALVPPGFAARDADAAPILLGLGITDVGCAPGSDASAFKRGAMRAWRAELYARLRAHLARVAAWRGAGADSDVATCAPSVVAFTGKRQWGALFEPPLARVAAGLQPPGTRPPGWPLPESCEVWVLPSSSGRAVMTTEEREGPYRALGARIAALPWPRDEPAR